jgi:circadian clock protein KaiB
MTEASKLTLFFTGDAPRSRRARTNLQATLASLGLEIDEVTEIDLLKNAQAALDYGIFATPALMVEPDDGESTVMYGDLSETQKLHELISQIDPINSTGG